MWDGGTHLLYLSAHAVLERFPFFQHCPFSSTISCSLHCWMYLTSELIGDTVCCSVLTCDLVICSNRRSSSVNSTSISDVIYMPHIVWIHYSYNQLANHLLRKHHLGSGYFYFAHLDALFLFTSSWAESGNNNNAQRVIVDVHIKSANKITAMPHLTQSLTLKACSKQSRGWKLKAIVPLFNKCSSLAQKLGDGHHLNPNFRESTLYLIPQKE